MNELIRTEKWIFFKLIYLLAVSVIMLQVLTANIIHYFFSCSSLRLTTYLLIMSLYLLIHSLIFLPHPCFFFICLVFFFVFWWGGLQRWISFLYKKGTRNVQIFPTNSSLSLFQLSAHSNPMYHNFFFIFSSQPDFQYSLYLDMRPASSSLSFCCLYHFPHSLYLFLSSLFP